jgi:hypothetical protein
LAVAAALLVALRVLSCSAFFEQLKLDRLDAFCSDCLAQFNSAVSKSAVSMASFGIGAAGLRLRVSLKNFNDRTRAAF